MTNIFLLFSEIISLEIRNHIILLTNRRRKLQITQ